MNKAYPCCISLVVLCNNNKTKNSLRIISIRFLFLTEFQRSELSLISSIMSLRLVVSVLAFNISSTVYSDWAIILQNV